MSESSVGLIIGIIIAVVVVLIGIIAAVIIYRRYSHNKAHHVDNHSSVNTIRIPAANSAQNTVSVSIISPPTYSPPIPSHINPPPYNQVARQPYKSNPRNIDNSVGYVDGEIYGGYGYSGECNEAFDLSMDSISDLPTMDDMLMTSSKTSIPAAVRASNSKGSKTNQLRENLDKNHIVNYDPNPSKKRISKLDRNTLKQKQPTTNQSIHNDFELMNKYSSAQLNFNKKHEFTNSGDSGAETGGPQCCSSPDMCPDSFGEIRYFATRPSNINNAPTTVSLRSSSGDSGVEAGLRYSHQNLTGHDNKMSWIVAPTSIETDV